MACIYLYLYVCFIAWKIHLNNLSLDYISWFPWGGGGREGGREGGGAGKSMCLPARLACMYVPGRVPLQGVASCPSDGILGHGQYGPHWPQEALVQDEP
jgi:hypothetical protein